MPLTAEQADHTWQLFKDSPLFARWPAFRERLADRLVAVPFQAGAVLFEPGAATEGLYLVGEGRLLELYGQPERVWFQLPRRSGSLLGQQALFGGHHGSRAVGLRTGTVYRMSAADVRQALEINPALRDSLLHEERAIHLRGVPWLGALPDADIRWLAQLTRERGFVPGEEIPLADRPGVWMIDRGQVAVAGPASAGEAGWRLTAGSFFLSAGHKGAGAGSVATSATASVASRLLYLPEAHLQRLLAAFPWLGDGLDNPADVPARLASVPLFAEGKGMRDRHLLHLAQFCAWRWLPGGQNITSQGNVGYSYVIMERGEAVVSAVDDQGHSRPRNMLRAGEHFGTTSLLAGLARDATVRAAGGGAEVLALDRRDLEVAFAERPDLWRHGVALFERCQAAGVGRREYEWLEDGEKVAWRGRPHLLWLLVPEAGLWLAGGGVTALLSILLGLGSLAGLAGLGLTGVVLALASFLTLVNYYNDYYVVTNRRVTWRDRQLLVWEARMDAPLEMVQDVTVHSGLLGRLLDIGDVTVRTAAKVGALHFNHVPAPELVKSFVLRERASFAAAARGQGQEFLRRGLVADLGPALAVPDVDGQRALGEGVRAPLSLGWWGRLTRHEPAPVAANARGQGQPGLRGILGQLTGRLPEGLRLVLFGPPAQPALAPAGQIVWHKHPLDLIQRAGLPFLALVMLLVAGATLILSGAVFLGVDWSRLTWPWLGLLAAGAAWTWWEVVDYWNDIYVVTNEKIMDIERKPLGLFSKRQEGGLERVQTVVSQQRGFWANVLNYGDVVIRTAAADEGFTFTMVGAPRVVQATVFAKLDALRRRQEERRAEERQQALIEGLEVYDDLRTE